jgi:hypothetical protein
MDYLEEQLIATRLTGASLHEQSIISRPHSFHDPMELEAGMIPGVETHCPGHRQRLGRPDGGGDRDAGRAQIITLFPPSEAAHREPVLRRKGDSWENRPGSA